MDWLPLRNALHPKKIQGLYECALVLSLSPELREFVNSQRLLFRSPELDSGQLDPHITVLYCGYQNHDAIGVLYRLAEEHNTKVATFKIKDVNSFSNQSGVLTNIHYRIESEHLQELHATLLESFVREVGNVQTPFVGTLYSPHISIFNRIAMARRDTTLIFSVPNKSIRRIAGGCHLVGELKR